MARALQQQLHLQHLSRAEPLRNWPAAGGVKEIALVNGVSVDAALSGFGPPAQGQADGFAASALAPSLLPVQRMAQMQALAAPRPDHQSAGIPVRAVALAPWVVQGWRAIGALQLRQQIVLLASGKRFNPPQKLSI